MRGVTVDIPDSSLQNDGGPRPLDKVRVLLPGDIF